jgi:hypothetical protein
VSSRDDDPFLVTKMMAGANHEIRNHHRPSTLHRSF